MSTGYIFTNCPNCGHGTPHHIHTETTTQPMPSYWCQECEQSRTLKPSELIAQGMRRAQAYASGTLQQRIAKELQKGE